MLQLPRNDGVLIGLESLLLIKKVRISCWFLLTKYAFMI